MPASPPAPAPQSVTEALRALDKARADLEQEKARSYRLEDRIAVLTYLLGERDDRHERAETALTHLLTLPIPRLEAALTGVLKIMHGYGEPPE
jgi:hypothetical protein